MSKWIANLLSYEKDGEKGKCPACGSTNIKVEESGDKRRSVTFTCENCGSSDHFDGTLEG